MPNSDKKDALKDFHKGKLRYVKNRAKLITRPYILAIGIPVRVLVQLVSVVYNIVNLFPSIFKTTNPDETEKKKNGNPVEKCRNIGNKVYAFTTNPCVAAAIYACIITGVVASISAFFYKAFCQTNDIIDSAKNFFIGAAILGVFVIVVALSIQRAVDIALKPDKLLSLSSESSEIQPQASEQKSDSDPEESLEHSTSTSNPQGISHEIK